MEYILDTNIISAFNNRNNKDNKKIKEKLQTAITEGHSIYIDGIIYYEIKRGLLDVKASKQIEIFDGFCKRFDVLFFDSQEVFDKATELYVHLKRIGKLLEDADILIAAMALHKNLTLVTDDSHFSRIEGITIENWLRQ